MICALCSGAHHATRCTIARTTLLAAGVTPGAPPAPEHRPAYRDEQRATLNPYDDADRAALSDSLRSLHEMVVEEGQRGWRQYRQARYGIALDVPKRDRTPSGVGRQRSRGVDGRFQRAHPDGMVSA